MKSIIVVGEPVAKARPRITRSGHVYTPAKTKEHEAKIREAWTWEEYEAIEGPVKLLIDFRLKPPKGHHKEYPSKRPDIDNLIKTVLDGLNGVAFLDDKQVIEIHADKAWTIGEPYTYIEVMEL